MSSINHLFNENYIYFQIFLHADSVKDILEPEMDKAEPESDNYMLIKRKLQSIYRIRNNAFVLMMRNGMKCTRSESEGEEPVVSINIDGTTYSCMEGALKSILRKEYDEVLEKVLVKAEENDEVKEETIVSEQKESINENDNEDITENTEPTEEVVLDETVVNEAIPNTDNTGDVSEQEGVPDNVEEQKNESDSRVYAHFEPQETVQLADEQAKVFLKNAIDIQNESVSEDAQKIEKEISPEEGNVESPEPERAKEKDIPESEIVGEEKIAPEVVGEQKENNTYVYKNTPLGEDVHVNLSNPIESEYVKPGNQLLMDIYKIKVRDIHEEGVDEAEVPVEDLTFRIIPLVFPEEGSSLSSDILIYVEDKNGVECYNSSVIGVKTVIVKTDQYNFMVSGTWDNGVFKTTIRQTGETLIQQSELERTLIRVRPEEDAVIGHPVIVLDEDGKKMNIHCLVRDEKNDTRTGRVPMAYCMDEISDNKRYTYKTKENDQLIFEFGNSVYQIRACWDDGKINVDIKKVR